MQAGLDPCHHSWRLIAPPEKRCQLFRHCFLSPPNSLILSLSRHPVYRTSSNPLGPTALARDKQVPHLPSSTQPERASGQMMLSSYMPCLSSCQETIWNILLLHSTISMVPSLSNQYQPSSTIDLPQTKKGLIYFLSNLAAFLNQPRNSFTFLTLEWSRLALGHQTPQSAVNCCSSMLGKVHTELSEDFFSFFLHFWSCILVLPASMLGPLAQVS